MELNGFLDISYFKVNDYLCASGDISCGVLWNDIGNRSPEEYEILKPTPGKLTQCTDPLDNEEYMSLFTHYLNPNGGPIICPTNAASLPREQPAYKTISDNSSDMIYQMFKNQQNVYNEIIIHMNPLDPNDKLTTAPKPSEFNKDNITAFFILKSTLDNDNLGQKKILQNIQTDYNNMYATHKPIILIDDTKGADTSRNPFSIYNDSN